MHKRFKYFTSYYKEWTSSVVLDTCVLLFLWIGNTSAFICSLENWPFSIQGLKIISKGFERDSPWKNTITSANIEIQEKLSYSYVKSLPHLLTYKMFLEANENLRQTLTTPYLKPCSFYFYSSLFPEAVVRMCSVKKVFLEISQNSQENTCAKFQRKLFFTEHIIGTAVALFTRRWLKLSEIFQHCFNYWFVNAAIVLLESQQSQQDKDPNCS